MPSRGSEPGLLHAAYRGVHLGFADAAVSCRLSTAANWNQSKADWEYLLRAGHGFGFESIDGDLVASTVVMPYPGGLAWIGMVLVAEAARRQGLATALIQRAIAWCQTANVVPLLDATAAGRAVYRALDFADVRPIVRWKTGARPPGALDLKPSSGPNADNTSSAPGGRAPPFDLNQWVEWDRPVFGADRSGLLRWLRDSRPDLALEIPGQGYCLGRSGRLATQVGPVVAASEQAAVLLLRRALQIVSGPVIVDVPAGRAEIERELRAQGLEPSRQLERMAWGAHREFGHPESIYAIAGLELG